MSRLLLQTTLPALRTSRPLISSSYRLLSSTPTSAAFLRSSPILRATGSVSSQPGSKSFKDFKDNAKEEAKDAAQTVASAIGGANARTGHMSEEGAGLDGLKGDLASIQQLAQKMPKDALLWGGAGLLPYAGTSLATVYLARQASLAIEQGEASGLNADTAYELLSTVQHIQITYGAIILSFLGAIHWGLEFAKYNGVLGNSRYAMGVAPVIVGWGSLMMAPQLALVTQWAAFFGTYLMDQKATNKGNVPRWYSTYRFWLTAVVGSSILFTLIGESYMGPDKESMIKRQKLIELRNNGGPVSNPKGESVTLGEMKASKTTDEDADGFVKFVNVKAEEEKKKKEAEEAKKKEKEEKEAQQKEEQEKDRKRKQRQSQSGQSTD